MDGKMTGASYVNIIRENLNDSIHKIWLDNFIFQQDNDSKHTSRIAKTYFEQSSISKLDWPSQLPDINPIEHLWSILDDRIPMESQVTLATFWSKLKEEWDNLPRHILANLVDSMPKRIQAIIDNKGGNTNY